MAYQTLAEFFGVDRVNFTLADRSKALETTAHLLIDVQRDFVHPKKWGTVQSEEIARNIGGLTAKFRQAGIAPYWIYYKEKNIFGFEKRASCAFGGFYKCAPSRGDVLIGKDRDSAFKGSDINEVLREKGVKNLIVSGFNTSACVAQTVHDAIDRGYHVCVVEDMTENGNDVNHIKASCALYRFEEKGAIVADSACVLEYLKGMTPA